MDKITLTEAERVKFSKWLDQLATSEFELAYSIATLGRRHQNAVQKMRIKGAACLLIKKHLRISEDVVKNNDEVSN